MRIRTVIGTFGLSMLLSAGQADAGLVSDWAGNGNANDSVGPNSGTLVNGVTFAPSPFGQAFSFNGNSYVQAGTIGLPTGNQDRSLNLWFNINSYSATVEEAWLAGFGGFGSFGQVYSVFVQHLRSPEDTVSWSQWGTGISGGPAIEPGTWHNLGVTNVGDFVTLYLDGVSVATGTVPMDVPPNTNFYLGYLPVDQGNGRALNGLIDEVRIYDNALSASEMKALATIPEPASLVMMGVGMVVLAGLVLIARLRAIRGSKADSSSGQRRTPLLVRSVQSPRPGGL